MKVSQMIALTKNAKIKKKNREVRFVVDVDTYDVFYGEALTHGGLSALLRVLMNMFLRGEISIKKEDVIEANRRAKRTVKA